MKRAREKGEELLKQSDIQIVSLCKDIRMMFMIKTKIYGSMISEMITAKGGRQKLEII